MIKFINNSIYVFDIKYRKPIIKKANNIFYYKFFFIIYKSMNKKIIINEDMKAIPNYTMEILKTKLYYKKLKNRLNISIFYHLNFFHIYKI